MKLPRAAQELDRSVSTLKRWIKSGYIKAVKIGRDWDISEKEIARIKSGRVRKRRVKNE